MAGRRRTFGNLLPVGDREIHYLGYFPSLARLSNRGIVGAYVNPGAAGAPRERGTGVAYGHGSTPPPEPRTAAQAMD